MTIDLQHYVENCTLKEHEVEEVFETIFKINRNQIKDEHIIKLAETLIQNDCPIYFRDGLFETSTDTEKAENRFGFGTCSSYSLRDLILLAFCRVQTKKLYNKVKEIIGDK